MDNESFYILTYSEPGAGDWNRTASKDYGSIEAALKDVELFPRDYDFCVVRRTIKDERVRTIYAGKPEPISERGPQ